MRRIFITGNPTAGKTTLARNLAEVAGATVFHCDEVRAQIRGDERYRAHVHFYLDQDERTYFESTTPDERWAHLVAQSEGMWPPTKEWVEAKSVGASGPLVFESVNLLPNLVARDFPGEPVCAVVSGSLDEALARLAGEPRWGATPELQALEANHFFNVEAPRYRALAESVGAPVFTSADEALPWCLDRLR